MKLGSVFMWRNFPLQEDGKVKDRYFIYLGKSCYTDNPIMVFLITATSRVHYYEEGGNRTHHNYIEFKAGQFCFTKDCIFDVNFTDHLEEINFLNHKEDIEEKTVLPESILKKIYNLILNSKTISQKIKKDIYINYNLGGITGLRNPQRR